MGALLLTVVLTAVAPGDGLGLAPGPAETADTPPTTVPSEPAPEEPEAPESPIVPLGAILAAAALLAAGGRGSREPAPGDGLGLTERPLVVFVPGHGTDAGDFDDLVALMHLEPEDYRVFDYRWAVETGDAVHASQVADINDTADALNGYVAGLSDGGRSIYLVGFSKGGAGIAELIARWDDGTPPPVPGVVGAALLEPPISGGMQGVVQSLGKYVGPIPDDGGYDPKDCTWPLPCEDDRDHLGEDAGIEVMVLRNPKAGVTNFNDRPEGMRIYDVPDEGRGPAASFFHNPFSYPRRVSEAHTAVLHDRRVADCILSEMSELGSCDIPGSGSGAPVIAD